MQTESDAKQNGGKRWIPAAKQAAFGLTLAAEVFSLVVCILLVAAVVHNRVEPPLTSPAMTALQAELASHPKDETLRQSIRELDLLARRAFFESQAFLHTGAWLLLAGLAVTLFGLKALSVLNRKLPDPGHGEGTDDSFAQNQMARWFVGAGGAAVAVVALVATSFGPRPFAPKPAAGASTASGGPAAAPTATAPAATGAGAGASLDEALLNWPNFRGPGGNGVAHFTTAPLAWGGAGDGRILWKTAVPKPGKNSPVVWGDRVYLTGADERTREVYCFDRRSGALLWTVPVPGQAPAGKVTVSDDTGYAAPTAATDGRRLFAIFASGDLAALDAAGKLLWSHAFGPLNNHYGHASSLIVYQDLLVVQLDQDSQAEVYALDAATGRTVWDAQRDAVSWASPICVDAAGRPELILDSSQSVIGYEPRTGKELWRQNCLSGEVGPSPAYADGMVFVANQYAKGVGIRLDAKDATSSTIAWETDESLPDIASPLAAAGRVFYTASDGTVTCLDAAKGTVLWQHSYDSGFSSSPILVGDRVYATDTEGVTHVFKADSQFSDLATSTLGEPVSATPAFLDACVLMRGDKHLYCIGAADAAETVDARTGPTTVATNPPAEAP